LLCSELIEGFILKGGLAMRHWTHGPFQSPIQNFKKGPLEDFWGHFDFFCMNGHRAAEALFILAENMQQAVEEYKRI
jgi:hypothetical protein